MSDGTDVMLQEILKRSQVIRRNREKRFLRAMTGVSCVLLGALVFLISVLSAPGPAEGSTTVMGAFLLPSQAGGYILVAVIAFAIGVIVTMITERYRKRKELEQES